MDTRALNYVNQTRGEITKDQFLNYLKVQKSNKINMFGYDSDIQRGDNYSKAYTWFIEKKQEASLNINKLDGLVRFPLIEREDGTIFDPMTGFDVDLYVTQSHNNQQNKPNEVSGNSSHD